MGGRSNAKDELLCRFIFPERPGALMKFLDALSPRWNISLFHYRGQVVFPTTSMHICYRYIFIQIIYFTILLHVPPGRIWCKCASWHPSCSNRDGGVPLSCKQSWVCV